jgi:hypothetical protein
VSISEVVVVAEEEGEEAEGVVGMALATAAGSHMAGCRAVEKERHRRGIYRLDVALMLFTIRELETSMPRNDLRHPSFVFGGVSSDSISYNDIAVSTDVPIAMKKHPIIVIKLGKI